MSRLTPLIESREEGGEAGFALVEVLVAFAILALVSLAMLRAFADTTVTIAEAAARETRLDLARTLLEEFRARSPMAPGLSQGEADGLAWAVEVAGVAAGGRPAPAGAPKPFRLAVAVAARAGQPADPGAPLLVTLALARDGGAP